MFREQIKKWFKEAIQLDPEIETELKHKLLRDDHPNLEKFYDNMTEQFIQAEKVCRARKIILKQKTLQDTVYDMAKVFVIGLKAEAEKRYASDLEKMKAEQAKQKIKEFEDVLSGNPTEEFLEAGIITDEKIDAQREEIFKG